MHFKIIGLILPAILIATACSNKASEENSASSLQNPGGTNGIKPSSPDQLNLIAASSVQIDISWQDNSDNEVSFKIERAISSGGPFTTGLGPGTFKVIKYLPANTTAFSDTGLSSGTEYFYRVYASNSSGSSEPTAIASRITSNKPLAAPSAPTNLIATAAAASIINLTWLDTSNSESNFSLERSNDNGSTFRVIAALSANTTSYQDINLIESKNYIYRVRATNEVGPSPYSADSSATTLAAGNKATFSYVNTNIIGPNCVHCHGAVMPARGINLSTFTGVRSLVSAGNSSASTLYTITNSGRMPPSSPLSADQINSIKAWIDAGAANN